MDKEKFSRNVSRAFELILINSILVGSATYLDLALIINWNRVMAKEQAPWATAVFIYPTVLLTLLASHTSGRNVRKAYESTLEAFHSWKNGSEKVEETPRPTNSKYFTVCIDGQERQMRFDEVIIEDLSGLKFTQGPSSINVELDNDYKSRKAFIDFRDKDRTLKFPGESTHIWKVF